MTVLHRDGLVTVIRFDVGEELVSSIGGWCSEQGIEAAAVVAGIGMLSDIRIGRYDGSEYLSRTIAESSEILSLQGNVSMKEGEPFVHLHVSLADEDFSAVGGHLFEGTVSMTIELVMLELDTSFVRTPTGGTFWKLENRG